MTDRKKIIAALADHGELTYDDMERITGVKRDKARTAVSDAKKVGHLVMHRDDVTGQPAYKITPQGREWIKSSGDARQALAKVSRDTTESLEKRAVAIAVDRHNKADDLREKLTQAETELARLTNVEADLAEWKRIAATAGCSTPEELRVHLAFQDTELVEATQRANEAQDKLADLEAEAASKIAAAKAELSDRMLTKLDEPDPAGYLVVTPNKPLRRFSKAHNADQIAAAAAKRSGIAEVFTIYPHKKAIRGVEWKKTA